MAPEGRIVWLASYPKSGNTWLRLLFANLLSMGEEPVDINRINLCKRYPVNRADADDITLIDTDLLTKDEADRLRPRIIEGIVAETTEPVYLKVHDAYRVNPDGEPVLGRGVARAALYIVRDPRDVAVSFSFHAHVGIDRAIGWLNSNHHTLAANLSHLESQLPQVTLDWSGHVASWTEQYDVPVHVLRYEDLRADPVGSFGAAIAFLGLAASRAQVERAARFADFTTLQRQEQQKGFSERSLKSIAPFFRSGRAGGWAETLTPVQQEAIAAAHRPMMERYGYL